LMTTMTKSIMVTRNRRLVGASGMICDFPLEPKDRL
jgi:hypothetical protein